MERPLRGNRTRDGRVCWRKRPERLSLRWRLQKGGADRAFAAERRALAAFHAAGYAHGPPCLRDICHRDGTVTFIDFERYRPRRSTPRGFRNDLVLFVHSLHADAGAGAPETEAPAPTLRRLAAD